MLDSLDHPLSLSQDLHVQDDLADLELKAALHRLNAMVRKRALEHTELMNAARSKAFSQIQSMLQDAKQAVAQDVSGSSAAHEKDLLAVERQLKRWHKTVGDAFTEYYDSMVTLCKSQQQTSQKTRNFLKALAKPSAQFETDLDAFAAQCQQHIDNIISKV
jgi:hypothetical protein